MDESKKIMRECEKIYSQLNILKAQRNEFVKNLDRNLPLRSSENQWRCKCTASKILEIQESIQELEQEFYVRLLKIAEINNSKKKSILKRFVSAGKRILFSGSKKVFAPVADILNPSDELIDQKLTKSEEDVFKNGRWDYDNLTPTKVQNFIRWDSAYSNSIIRKYGDIHMKAYRDMVQNYLVDRLIGTDENKNDIYNIEGIKVLISSKEEYCNLFSKLVPVLDIKYRKSAKNELDRKKADQETLFTISDEQIEEVKPVNKEDLSPEIQKRFEEIHRKQNAKLNNLIEKQDSYAVKKEKLLGKYSDIIYPRLYKLLNDVEGVVISKELIDKNTSQIVDEFIKLGEEKYGDNFVEDIMNEPTNEPVIWLLDEIIKDDNKIKTNDDELLTMKEIMEIASNLTPEMKKYYEDVKSSLTKYPDSKKYLNAVTILNMYNSMHKTDSNQDIHATNLTGVSDVQSPSEQVVNETIVTAPIDYKNMPVDQAVSQIMDYNMPNGFNAIEESEEAMNTQTIEDIATNLTPELKEHYRSIEASFRDNPNSPEYLEASAVLRCYENMQHKADMDSLYHGNVR